MQEEVQGANTVLPLFFIDLVEDVMKEPGVPKSKGFGPLKLDVMVPKDRRLQALVLLFELGNIAYKADKRFNAPGERFTDPYIENAIETFTRATGLPEEDVRAILHRPRRAGPEEAGPAPPPDETIVKGVFDP